MRRTPGQIGFFVALAILVAFSGWSVQLVYSVSSLRASVDTRMRWLMGIQQLQVRVEAIVADVARDVDPEHLASDVVKFANHGLDVLGRMEAEWQSSVPADPTVGRLLAELATVKDRALRPRPSERELRDGPARVAQSLHDLVAVIRADNAILSQSLGHAVGLLHLLVFGALALAAAACVLLVLLRRRTQRLAASEQRFSLAAAGARDGIWDWDLRRRRVHFSPRWREMLRLSDRVRLNHVDDWVERIHPDDAATFRSLLQSHLAGRSAFFENEHRLRVETGGYLWVLARGVAVRDRRGKAVRVAGSLTDITFRRQTAAHQEAADLLARATREVGIGVALHTSDEKLSRVSSAMADMIGGWQSAQAWWSDVQRFGWIPAASTCPDCQRPSFRGAMQAALPDPTGHRHIFEITWAVHAHGISDDPDVHILLVQEVTDKMVSGEQLADSEHAYALAARATNDAVWEWYMDDNRVLLSPRWREMLGLEEEDAEQPSSDATAGAWLSRVHPSDLRGLQDAIAAHLDGLTNRLEFLHRVRGADGSYRWLTVHGVAIRDHAGKPVRIVGSFRDVTDLRATETELRRSAERDGLTGLLNRAAFCSAVSEALEEARTTGEYGFAVAGIDLDGMALVNDTLGSMQGDRVLRAAARRLLSVVGEGELIGRIGGDEFGMLIRDVASEAELNRAFERIQAPLSQPIVLDGQDIYASASVGVARSNGTYCSGQDLLRDSETAMRRAAKRGLASKDVYQRRTRTAARKTLRLNADLRRALDRRELVLHYQPLVPVFDRHHIAFEALVRWRHPEFGLVSPGAFIPLAEETGLIVPIGLWVFREACRQVALWNRTAAEPVAVSINVSARQLQEPDLVGQMSSIIEQTGVDPAALHLEITESLVMESPDEAVQKLTALKALGAQLSIDDFGTGYSSLSYLQRLPIDILKIDRSFISPVEGGDCKEIVSSIVELAHKLGLVVIAEGVETEQQLSTLKGLGCDVAQGYLFSRPVPAVDATRLIEDWDDRFSPFVGRPSRPKLRVLESA